MDFLNQLLQYFSDITVNAHGPVCDFLRAVCFALVENTCHRVSTGAGQKMQEIRVRIANPPCIRIIFGLLVKLP